MSSSSMGSNSGAGPFRRGARPSASSLESLRSHCDRVLLRRDHRYFLKNHPAGTIAVPKPPTAPAAGCRSLALSLRKDELGDYYARMSPGIVSGPIASGSAYTGVPLIGVGLLTVTPRPTIAVTEAGKIYIKVTWVPVGVEDSFGDWSASGGAIETVEIIFASAYPANVTAEVNVTNGVPTVNGVYHWIAGIVEATEDPEVLTLVTSKCGHRDVIICGNADVRLIWSGP